MTGLLDYAPIAATCFAVPEFLPQIRKLAATRDTAGISWSWAALTSVNNAAWLAYFILSRYWTALIPSSSATLLAGILTLMLIRRHRTRPQDESRPQDDAGPQDVPGPQSQARRRPAIAIAAWAAMLACAGAVAGRTGLGTLLTAAFVLQVTPSIWAAYRTARPTGSSAGTWLLILGELTCWLTFGLHTSDPRLITLGATGTTASLLMLARIRWTAAKQPYIAPPAASTT
jgi:uncharacterized protein with PQ loop repeat